MATLATALAILLLFGGRVEPSSCATEEDRIRNLPGWPADEEMPVMYSGYLTLGTDRRRMFYWLVKREGLGSEEGGELVFWTNGGPGCSGLLGLFAEQGPMRITKSMKLKKNPFSWHKRVSMLFVEQPLHVGFSWSDEPLDRFANDSVAANQMHHAIRSFYDKFPEFRTRPLHLASESYGGKYLPELTKRILEGNANPAQESLPLVGFLVGNPYTDPVENGFGMFATFAGHGLVPWFMFTRWNATCGGVHPFDKDQGCKEMEKRMSSYVFDHLNPYALDFPACVNPASRKLLEVAWEARVGEARYTKAFGSFRPDPCLEEYLAPYLNSREVQQAIHAETTVWQTCRDPPKLAYNMTELQAYSQPVWRQIIDHGLKFLIFSGDDDSVCATQGTEYWLRNMGWNVVGSEWEPWFLNKRLGGYLTHYDHNVTFATVHAAGHEVPEFQPERADELLRRYLNNAWWHFN